MNPYDPTVDIKLNVGHWPIVHDPVILDYILETFDVWLIVWDYVTYISWSNDFRLHFEDHLMYDS